MTSFEQPSIGAPSRRSTHPLALLARIRGWVAVSSLFSIRHPSQQYRQAAAADAARTATILQFPLARRGLLLQLAHDLQRRQGDPDDPVLLTLASGPQHRLFIDSTAYIDICSDRLPYRVVLGDGLSARITLETVDFAEARSFVDEYLLLTRGPLGATP